MLKLIPTFVFTTLLFVSSVAIASLPLTQTLPLPPENLLLLQNNAPPASSSKPALLGTLHHVTIPKNGSLSKALASVGMGASVSYKIRQLKNSRLLTRLKAGDTLDIRVDDKKLLHIFYPKNAQQHIELSIKDGHYQINEVTPPITIKVVTASGTIKDSFYLSGVDAGLSPKTILDLSDIFTWEIDFIRELRKHDPFKVIYEKKYIDGKFVGNGDILSAEIMVGKKHRYTAFLLKDKNGKKIGYYDANQKNLKKSFLKNPVDYVRISSRFNPRRFHPVLKKWKSHRGVDYAGPTGTPIHATGKGVIVKRYYSASYGRVIFIQHANQYTTVYGHMSKFGRYKKGQTVRQGQTIGYIGSSGRATGPHLHYEFRIRGKHVDPLKMKFPAQGPVPKKHRTKFAKFERIMSAQMDRLDTQWALNFE